MIVMMIKFKYFLHVVAVITLMLGGMGVMLGPISAGRADEAAPAPADAEAPLRLLVFGDSLVAGYGLPQNAAFPAILEAALKGRGHDISVINSGVSGETSAGGASRIDWALADNPDAVLVVLGGNDALRGLPPEAMAANLETILTALEGQGVQTLVAGMRAPANLGATYAEAFDKAFADTIGAAQARGGGVLFYPFFLEGVALIPELNQNDGIHPNAAGVAVIVDNILPHVERLIASVREE